MTRPALLFAVILLGLRVQAADQTELNGNEALFAVMAALDATQQDSAISPNPVRAAVDEAISSRKLQIVSELKTFVATHRKADKGSDIAQYVSFALTSGEPPEFQPRFIGTEVPPDVEALEGFAPLMRRFYKEADIEGLWQKSQGSLNQALAQYQESVSRALLEVNAYMRNPTSGYMGRRFLVYIDLLGQPGQVHTRSYKDDYFIVVTPSPEPQIGDIRHAYLHYLADPLATKFYGKLDKKRGVIDYAQAAPALEESYKSDFLLLATESLLKAIESRLDRKPGGVEEALAHGFVLAPHFAERLPVYEKEGASMRLYFPEMVDQIDLQKEERRLELVKFASAKPVRHVTPAIVNAPPISPAEQSLNDAEKLYTSRKLDEARDAFLRILRETDTREHHARAYYGLARVAALQRNPDLAEQLFHKSLDSSPDPHTRSWAEVYLGRLSENSSKPEDAGQHYRAALAVEGAPLGAKQAAGQGLRKLEQKQN